MERRTRSRCWRAFRSCCRRDDLSDLIAHPLSPLLSSSGVFRLLLLATTTATSSFLLLWHLFDTFCCRRPVLLRVDFLELVVLVAFGRWSEAGGWTCLDLRKDRLRPDQFTAVRHREKRLLVRDLLAENGGGARSRSARPSERCRVIDYSHEDRSRTLSGRHPKKHVKSI